MNRSSVGAGGVALLALVTALPWATTGATTRNGYALARAVDRAGLATGGWGRALVVALLLVPALAAAALVAWSLRRTGLVVTLVLAASAAVGSGGVVVLRAPVEPAFGVYIALAVSAGSLAAVAATRERERG
jgi:hypothetical protein